MEVTHTNPIMLGEFIKTKTLFYFLLAFCYSLYEDAVQRRQKHCYDDECCIAEGELDDEEIVPEPKPKAIENTSSKTSTRSGNGSVSKKNKVHAREPVALIAKKQKSIDIDDEEGLSIEETKPKTKSRSPSVVRSK
jgi:hypothetical protein